MKKIFSICLLLLATVQLTKAQTNNITGTVKDEQGNPLHFVFVHDNRSKNAAFTDSLGNFSIYQAVGSKLQFQLSGHSDTSVNIDKGTANLQIALRSSGKGGGAGSSLSAHIKLSTEPVGASKTDADMNTLANGSTISAIAHQKGNTRGNRYLFDEFAHGYVINTQNVLVYDENYRFDYDKIGGVLLLTEDNNNVTQVSDLQIMSFTLFSNTDQLVTFEQVPAIDKTHYVQVLASGAKYNIYKSIKTRLVKASYTNAGITSHGNDYDEFVDDIDYYFVDTKTNQPVKFNPKKKALKTIFAAEPDKINKYITDHSGDIDDMYLSNLGAYMNQ
jgi:hypothetical protein